MPTTPSGKHLHRITWEAAPDGGYAGHIRGRAHGYDAKIELFEVTVQGSGGIRARFHLKHRLPFRPIHREFPTARTAQQHAERFLLLAVELLGFVPATPRTRVEHKKTFKVNGEVKRLGWEEPKHIIAETADFVIIEIQAKSGKPLGEQAIPKAKFEELYDRMEAPDA